MRANGAGRPQAPSRFTLVESGRETRERVFVLPCGMRDGELCLCGVAMRAGVGDGKCVCEKLRESEPRETRERVCSAVQACQCQCRS